MNNKKRFDIEKKVNEIRKNITDYGIFDIFDFADKLGYSVIRYPIGKDSILGFAMNKDSEKIIFSNSSEILAREIFTVAHEIGHHILHLSEDSESIIDSAHNDSKQEIEVEADYFAACLLMPEDKVKDFVKFKLDNKAKHNFTGIDVAQIQTTFHVSYNTVIARLGDLSIIDDEIKNKLYSEKLQKTTRSLLKVISGNIDLCDNSDVKVLPKSYLEWVISNYNDKLIPKTSLETAVSFFDLCADDVIEDYSDELDQVDEDDLDDLIGGLD